MFRHCILLFFFLFKQEKIHSRSPHLTPPGHNMEFSKHVRQLFYRLSHILICLIASSRCNLTCSVSCILENWGFGWNMFGFDTLAANKVSLQKAHARCCFVSVGWEITRSLSFVGDTFPLPSRSSLRWPLITVRISSSLKLFISRF